MTPTLPAFDPAAFWAALGKGDVAEVERWLPHPDLNLHRQLLNDWTPLFLVAAHGHHEMAARLIAHDPSQAQGLSQGPTGGAYTPLMVAAQNGDERMVALLLPHSPLTLADSDVRGVTALMLAAENGHVACVHALLSVMSPEEVDAFDWQGCTALMRTVQFLPSTVQTAARIEIVRALVPLSDLTALDQEGFDTLNYAIFGNDGDVVSEVMARQTIVPSPPGTTTLLMHAAARRSTQVLSMVLPFSDVHATDEQGLTALHHAVRVDSHAAVAFLIAQDPSQEGPNDQPLLMFAVQWNAAQALELLLPLNDPTAEHEGVTAMEMALDLEHWPCADILAVATMNGPGWTSAMSERAQAHWEELPNYRQRLIEQERTNLRQVVDHVTVADSSPLTRRRL